MSTVLPPPNERNFAKDLIIKQIRCILAELLANTRQWQSLTSLWKRVTISYLVSISDSSAQLGKYLEEISLRDCGIIWVNKKDYASEEDKKISELFDKNCGLRSKNGAMVKVKIGEDRF